MEKYFFTEEEFNDMSNPALTMEQLILLREPTPESEIEIKQDAEGNSYKSVKGSYMKKRMNLIFGFNYDFQIKSRDFFPSASEAIVEGRLTIRSGEFTIVKEQFGKHILTTKGVSRGSQAPSGIGNAFKSAATDAFKKCASEIGLCWDIYTQEIQEPAEETVAPEEDHASKKITERLEHFLKMATTPEDLEKVVKQFKDNNTVSQVHEDLIEEYKKHLQKASKK